MADRVAKDQPSAFLLVQDADDCGEIEGKTIRLREPPVKHDLTLAQLQRFGNGATGSPALT